MNILRALLWQHNSAPRITALMQAKQAWYERNHVKFWEDWQKNVFVLDTADAFGLQVWGVILGVPISIGGNNNAVTVAPFGFGEFNKNFDNANFSDVVTPNGVVLDVEDARVMLKLRYFYLICRPCADQINEFLEKVYPNAKCFDNLNMGAIVYNFERPVSPPLMAVFLAGGILPRPATIGININVAGRPVFGFGDYNKNFNNGTFSSIQ